MQTALCEGDYQCSFKGCPLVGKVVYSLFFPFMIACSFSFQFIEFVCDLIGFQHLDHILFRFLCLVFVDLDRESRLCIKFVFMSESCQWITLIYCFLLLLLFLFFFWNFECCYLNVSNISNNKSMNVYVI